MKQPVCNENIDIEPVYENTDIPSRDIPLKELHAYVMMKRSNSVDSMKKEFEDLGTKQRHSWDVAKHSDNKTKNRYANVVTYDKSRVILKLDGSTTGSDYINASYIDGFNYQREYIACQGPNTASVNDMWRMIVQENVVIIVMVTNLVEGKRTKCQKYWPDIGCGQTYVNIVVTNMDESDHGYYTIRKFKVDIQEMSREVWQYHFTDWPDKSVPPVVTPLVEFIYEFKEAKKVLPSSTGPYVVHCSAGAGRTGTVITIDAMLDMAERTETVNVFNFVRNMRENRVQMVQTEEQYGFIYEVLLQVLFCGKTSLPASEFLGYFPILTKRQGLQHSIMDLQLKTLNSLSPNPPATLTTAGVLADNVMKNRFEDIIPIDTTRPYLMTPSKNGNDYINASFCNSYRKRNGFIVTQAPLSDQIDTSEDFWRLVYDYEVHTIVMLNNQDHTGLANYFPETEATHLRYGAFEVQLQSTQNNNHMTLRRLTLQKMKAQTIREIQHYAFTAWPNDVTVPQPIDFLNLLSDVERWQAAHPGKPVVIHCLDGCSRSGLFCSLSSIVEKIKEEHIIDVFQTIKSLRNSCPRFVKIQEQYKFCYDAVRFYMEGFETYGNFK
ncbi:receptor-type tyrosine-protein phosphatase kappa-like [Anneissia japonica]|uniref:receptor-type tyrosine-protein phosphatase kappa-like n=1 Tax=Anneissia japonica TaxID=1529436 RepID=UPI001425A650|nr:receptor-type tyrosine-protein phosphatase kappa-like [Anneissia japonica]